MENCEIALNLSLKYLKHGRICYMMKMELRLLQKLDHLFELQLPLLINNKLVSDEITNIRGPKAVLQVSDLLEYKGAYSDRGVSILLVFLSSQLIMSRNLVIPESSSCTL
ncbi:hypothetical protein Tco_1240657 [Tanacetum coccineum]